MMETTLIVAVYIKKSNIAKFRKFKYLDLDQFNIKKIVIKLYLLTSNVLSPNELTVIMASSTVLFRLPPTDDSLRFQELFAKPRFDYSLKTKNGTASCQSQFLKRTAKTLKTRRTFSTIIRQDCKFL